MREEAGGIRDDGGGDPEAAVEHLDQRVRFAEVRQGLLPRRGRPRRRPLGDVAEDGGRPGRAAAPDGPQMHGGEILGLVEDDVAQARRTVDEIRELVKEDEVGGGPPRGRPGARRVGPQQDSLLFDAQEPVGVAAEQLGVGPQGVEHPLRVDGGPERRGILPDGGAARDGVLDDVVGGVAGALHGEQDEVRQPLREHRPRRAVAHAAIAQLVEDVLHEVCRDPPLARPTGDDQGLGGRADVRPHGPSQQLGHPRIAFEDSAFRGVDPARRG